MSCITENTIVVRKSAEPDLLHDFSCEDAEMCRLRNCNRVYDNEEIVVYVFDCNGDQPWDVVGGDGLKLKPEDILCTETKYDEDELWTRVNTDGILRDTETPLDVFLKPLVPGNDYEDLAERISYSI